MSLCRPGKVAQGRRSFAAKRIDDDETAIGSNDERVAASEAKDIG